MTNKVTLIDATLGIGIIEKRIATVHRLVPRAAPIKVPIMTERNANMAATAAVEVAPRNSGGNVHTMDVPAITLFHELWMGDDFEVVNDPELAGVLFTKIRHDQARRHSDESRELRTQGFGYVDDSIVTVKQSVIVRFVPKK